MVKCQGTHHCCNFITFIYKACGNETDCVYLFLISINPFVSTHDEHEKVDRLRLHLNGPIINATRPGHIP